MVSLALRGTELFDFVADKYINPCHHVNQLYSQYCLKLLYNYMNKMVYVDRQLL